MYDEWARELQFRYVPGVTTKVPAAGTLSAQWWPVWGSISNACAPPTQARGGEDVLLDGFDGLGLHCEARTQLVVICEVCRRPSTKECWTCGMKICDFCTLKRHWKVP